MMKQLLEYLFLPAALALAVSCTKELAAPQSEGELAGEADGDAQVCCLTVSLPQDVKTRIDDKTEGVYPLTWSEGDIIFANGVASKPLAASRAGAAAATFSFPNPLSAPYNITYCGSEGSDDIVIIPPSQVTTVPQYYKTTAYTPTFLDGVEPMYAYSEDGKNVSLSHLGAVLRIPLVGDADTRQIRHILVSSDADEPVGGTFRIGRTSAGRPDGKLSAVSGTSSVSIVCNTGFTTLSTSGSRVYVAVVAPGEYSEGITASIVASDGAVMYLHSFKGMTLEAGRVYEYPESVFAADDKVDITIQNESQLAAFYTKLQAGQKALSAVIVKNITLKSPSTTWPESVNKYSGCLDGGGHTVVGLQCPMFSELDGTVKNLVLDSDIDETLPVKDTCWSGILARRIYQGGYVRNCTVKGSLKVNSQTQITPAVGGVVGYIVRGGIRGCTNEASITVETDNSNGLYVGGLVGRSYASTATIDIEGLVNRGTISVSGTPSEAIVGGIIGESCRELCSLCNDGTVFSSGMTAKYVRIGGVAGHITSATSSVSGLSSTARARVRVENFISTDEVGISIAGLVAYSSAGCTFSECTNAGDVELVNFTPAANPTRLCMGGAIAFHSSSSDLILSGVSNSGRILVEGPLDRTGTSSIANVSGLCGLVNQYGITDDVSVTMDGCSNCGKIELDCGIESRSGFVMVSGLVSAINAGSFVMTGCRNRGDLCFTGLADTLYFGGHVARLGAAQATRNTRNVVITGAVNDGDILLTEPSCCANRTAAGGIVGITASPIEYPLTINLTSCTNNGTIDRRTSVAVAKKSSYAGGVAGAVGYSEQLRSTSYLMGVGGSIECCTNNGMIRFNQVAGDDPSDAGEESDGSTFTGGIAGLVNSVHETGGVTLRSCVNRGNLWSTCGRHGGICGLVKGCVHITGDKDYYTKNEGLVTVRSDGEWNSGAEVAYLYCGGIVGQVQNTANHAAAGDSALLEYCHNLASVGGGTVAGGILGAVNSGDSNTTIVRYCKNSGLVQILRRRTARGAYSIVGRYAEKMKSISDCAVGGKCLTNPGSGTGTSVPLTPGNWFTYVACGADSPIYTTAAAAQADGNLYWDGVSATPWEK